MNIPDTKCEYKMSNDGDVVIRIVIPCERLSGQNRGKNLYGIMDDVLDMLNEIQGRAGLDPDAYDPRFDNNDGGE